MKSEDEDEKGGRRSEIERMGDEQREITGHKDSGLQQPCHSLRKIFGELHTAKVLVKPARTFLKTKKPG